MVDHFAYFQFNRHEAINLRALGAVDPVNDPNIHTAHHGFGRFPPSPVPMNHRYELYDSRAILTTEEKKMRPEAAEQVKLSDEELLICVPFVRGYSFKSKEWGKLDFPQL
jgi:hypothetical protein